MLFLVVGSVSAQNVAKIGSTEYATFAAAMSAVQDGDVIYLLADADASNVAFTPCNNKTVIIAGKSGNEVLNMGTGHKGGIQNSNITFLNLKMKIRHSTVSGTWYTEGMYHATKIKYENVVIDGAICTYNDVDFLNCTFTNNPQNAEYTTWNYGGTQIFKGCTFEAASAGTKSFIKLYNQGMAASVAVVDCEFKDPSTLPSGWKGCDIYNSNPASVAASAKIYTDNNTYTGDKLVGHSGGSEGIIVCNSVAEMGVTLPTPTILSVAADLTISTKEDLIAFEQAVNAGNTYTGKLVVLENDIDLDGVEWKPIGNVTSYPGITFSGTFDGQNHTISNMTTSDNLVNYATAGFFGSSNGTIKNLTLTNVKVTSTHYAAGICGYTSDKALKIENCKVISGTITSTPELIGSEYDNGDKVGGILGYGVADATISGCAVEGLTITAHRDLGGIAGYMPGLVSDCSVKNTSIVQSYKNGYKTNVTTYKEIVGRDANANNTGNVSENVELKTVSGADPVTVDVPTATEDVAQVVTIEKEEDAPEATEEEKTAATTAVTTVLEEISNNTTVTSDEATNVAEVEDVTTLKIEVKNVAVVTKTENAQATATVTKVTYDVQPMKDEEKLSETTEVITFRLPVPQSFTSNIVKVSHNHNEVTSSTYETVQGEGANKYVELASDKFSEWTLEDINPNTVAVIGETTYTSLNAAFRDVENQEGDNVVITVLQDVTEALQDDYEFAKNITLTADKPVTIDFVGVSPLLSLDAHLYNITVSKNINIINLGQFFATGYSGSATINGNISAQQLWVYQAPTVRIAPTSTVNLGYGDGMLKMRYSGKLIVDGTANDAEHKQLTAGYISADYSYQDIYKKKEIMLKDTYVSVGWISANSLNTGNANALNPGYYEITLDNATLEVSHEGNQGMILGDDNYDNQSAINWKNNSLIITPAISNVKTINIDATGITTDKVKIIDYTGSAAMTLEDYATTINVENGLYRVVVEDNDLYIVNAAVAKIGDVGYASLAEAIAAVPTNGTASTIKMLADVDLESALTVANTKNITLDLNGRTVKNDASKTLSQLITVNGKLTIDDSSENGKIQNTASGKYVLSTGAADAELTLANGTVQSTTGTNSKSVYASKGTFVMTGGKILSTGYGVSATTVNISGGEISAYDMAVSSGGTISGGTLTSTTKYAVYTGTSSNKQMVVSGGTFTPAAGKAAVVIYCANAKVTGGTFNVSNAKVIDFSVNANTTGVILPGSLYTDAATDAEIYVNEELYGYYSIAATNKMTAPAAETTYKLTKDVNVNTSLTNKFISVPAKVVAINLNGKNITSTGTTALDVAARTSAPVLPLTIEGEGTVSANNGGGCIAVNVNQGVNLTIKGGTYKVGGDDDNTTIYIMKAYEKYPSTVNIEGGNFYATTNGWALNIKDDVRDYAKFNVSGGTFHDFNPADNNAEGEHTNFVEAGYESVDNGDGTWTVKVITEDDAAITIIDNEGRKCNYKANSQIILEDGVKSVSVKNNVEVNMLRYNRTFNASAGSWQSWVVPFNTEVSNEENSPIFAKIVQFAYVDASGKIVDDANSGELVIVVDQLSSDDIVKANYPYFVKVKAPDTYTFWSSDNRLYKTTPKKITMSTSTKEFTFTGVYERIEKSDIWMMNLQGQYSHMTTLKEVNPYRWYFTINSKNVYGEDDDWTTPSNVRVLVLGEDELATSIMNAIKDMEQHGEKYDISGRMIQHNQNGLYINAGKKYLKK